MTSRSEPFVAWPGANLRKTLPLCLFFAILFVVCYGGASWWTSRLTNLPVWDLPFESRIPFVPSFALVYLTITPVLMLAPFVLRTRGELVPFAATLSVETVVATSLFLVFPQTTSFAQPAVDGFIGMAFRLADTMNLELNQFPSLHVAFACTAAWAYATRSGRMGRLAWFGWCLTVIASTWLIHEHNIIDIAGGVVLSVAGLRLIYQPLQSAKAGELLWGELCCLEQCARFSMRHRRYFVIFLAIWIPSITRWREARVVRVAFCVAQWIDDILDGDRASTREPLKVVDELLDSMEARQFSIEPLSRLTKILFEELDAFEGRGRDPHAEFIALVREMRIDRERVLSRAIWNEEELDGHMQRTFELSVDLMLLVSRCEARASEVPSLIALLGWCSIVRDLEDDVRHGLVNVPGSVWPASAPEDRVLTLRELEELPEFRQWAEGQLCRAEALVPGSRQEVEAVGDERARRILETFQKSIERFAQRQRRQIARENRVSASGVSYSVSPEAPERAGHT